ncbi:MAG: hypothetical protein RLZZ479_1404 [Bacteroidota bacterium]|jgi:hypothetical protein
MGDLKPLGSEKLQGMDKINRILQIAKYKETDKQNVNENSSLDYTIELADGYTYGIVKERLGYIIKKGLNESFLEYSEPMQQRKYFRSYSEAMKKLNLTAAELNRIHENDEGISLIGEQTAQKKKFILKLPKTNKTPDVGGGEETTPPPAPATPPPAEPAPAEPAPDAGTPPTGEDMEAMPPAPEGEDMGGMAPPTGEDMGEMPPAPEGEDMGEMPPAPEGPSEDDFDLGSEEGGGKGGSFKSIQRLTGKLSQRLRTIEKEKSLDSDDIKYVLNSILSAINLENLEEDDREDILSKFDEEDEYGVEGPGELDMPSEDDFDMGGGSDMETPAPPAPSEPMEGMNRFNESVEKTLSKYFKVDSTEKTILEEKRKKDFLRKKLQIAEIKKELVKYSETTHQLEVALDLLKENAKFVGKTNQENLIFIRNGKQVKVTPRGGII